MIYYDILRDYWDERDVPHYKAKICLHNLETVQDVSIIP